MEYLLEYMKSKGVDIEGKDIIITNGFTEGLEMLCEAYTSPGDKIICENPTHNTSIKIMKVHGIEVVGVKMNEDGIDILELEEKLKAAKVPMIVVHFDENFETTYTEEYNLENFELSEWQIESFARILLPSIREYYKDPKHVQEANEWTKQQNKQSIDT